MSRRAWNPTPKGGTRTQRSAFTGAATKLGITFSDYMIHFDAGERWCAHHKTWEDKAVFYARPARSTGVDVYCRAAVQERRGARKASSS